MSRREGTTRNGETVIVVVAHSPNSCVTGARELSTTTSFRVGTSVQREGVIVWAVDIRQVLRNGKPRGSRLEQRQRVESGDVIVTDLKNTRDTRHVAKSVSCFDVCTFEAHCAPRTRWRGTNPNETIHSRQSVAVFEFDFPLERIVSTSEVDGDISSRIATG